MDDHEKYTGTRTPTGVAAYLRVSSKTQDHATQKASIERAAAARGDTITSWYAERRSGKTIHRPGLDRLRSDARAGLVRRLYIFKLDRLTRSGVADTYEVCSAFKKSGCEVIAVADNLHLKPGADDIVTDVFLFALGLAAKLERTSINERISAARDRLAAEGRPWGRPSRLGTQDRERIASLRANGMSIRDIAQTLGVPRSTIARALTPSFAVPKS